MKLLKNSLTFFCISLLAITVTGFSMDQPEPKPKKPSKLQRLRTLANNILDALHGNRPVSYIPLVTHVPIEQQEPFPFTELPKDIQNKIVSLLTIASTAESLEIAVYTINQLAQVNKELNQLINDPQFCLQIIKSLSQRFNCSDAEACQALKIKQAKEQLFVQQELYELCMNLENYNELSLNAKLIRLIQNPIVDLNFTYGKNQLTPLILCIFVDKKLAYSLIQAGADPELAAGGYTPLEAAQEFGNQELVEFIKNTINKKHQKK